MYMSRNSIESNTKEIIRQKQNHEITAKSIGRFATFKKEAIIKALKIGGEIPDIYANIVKFDRLSYL